MSDEIRIQSANAAPSPLTIRAMEQFIRTGTVPVEYLRESLGDITKSVSPGAPAEPIRVTPPPDSNRPKKS